MPFCLVWAADGAVPVAVVEAVITWLDAGRPKPDRAAATIGAMVAGIAWWRSFWPVW